jgi:hypothetical protein
MKLNERRGFLSFLKPRAAQARGATGTSVVRELLR